MSLMGDTSTSNLDTVLKVCDQLERLNPDALTVSRENLLACAASLPADLFSVIQPRVETIVGLFVESTFKRRQSQIMEDYFAALEATTKRLLTSPSTGGSSNFGKRLLPVPLENEQQWLAVIAEAPIEEKTHRAMDANANRNEVVGTPLELVFRILFLIQPDRAFDWSLDQLNSNPQFEDADVFRDLLMVWNDQADIPLSAVKTLLPLLNRPLDRFFPGTAAQLQRLVRLSGLRALKSKGMTRGSIHEHLTRILNEKSGPLIDDKLELWLDAAVEQLGNHTANFIAAASRVDDRSLPDNDRELARRQVFTAVRAADALHPAIIVGADIFLKRADGAHTLALAFLGINRSHLKKWRRKLEEKATAVVRHVFLQDLRDRRDSVDTIRKFCLGDELLFTSLYMKLDLLSRQFGSVEDREKTVDVLAANYASFRETDLLADKITSHFRRLSKLLHADSVLRLIPADEKASIGDLDNLPAALARASESRRYLEGRRALDRSIEDMRGAEMTFEQQLKAARTSLLRGLL